ncbi:hypothetical protein [Xanthomonas euvesicatoria]|uniref:Uncharacterized protein n=1 Tax=Xanthomonas euvesicatoria TaxID=456327 RepID=A0AAW3U7Q4_XANEU|nr:hypothetical protein [Xanthomonas euvesicatoria]MBB4724974.1 hypothetical protein [Xanthomonas euvesicatoria]
MRKARATGLFLWAFGVENTGRLARSRRRSSAAHIDLPAVFARLHGWRELRFLGANRRLSASRLTIWQSSLTLDWATARAGSAPERHQGVPLMISGGWVS